MANILFQNALNLIPQQTPPVWMMRQAGRYHSHYRKLREKYSFMELCKIPELAAETTLGPIQEFDFDVAILFSDLLFPLEVLGMGLEYKETGPELGFKLDNTNFNKLLPVNDCIHKLEFQKQAMKIIREQLPKDKSLIGFVGGGWTLFSYAASGKHDGGLKDAKVAVELREKFMTLISELLIKNIQMQLDGGAEIVMIFDTAAGELSPIQFNDIVIPELKTISSKFPKKIGYYARGVTDAHLKQVETVENLAGFGVDHRFDMSKVLSKKGNYFLQGNFDQSLLFLEDTHFLKELNKYMEPIKELSLDVRKGWVSGLGHGVLPKTPEKNVRLFVETIRRNFK
jgi:uroporphyrinogen decarboxylase